VWGSNLTAGSNPALSACTHMPEQPEEFPDRPRQPWDRPTRPPPPGPAPADARGQGGSFRLFRVAGIDVFLHWSWLVVAYFELQLSPQRYGAPVWGVVEYLSVFGIVLLHEFGHVLACRQVGGRANRIVLWPLGGVALVNPPPRPGAFLWTLAAGPLVNVALVPVTVALVVLGGLAGWGAAAPDAQHFVVALAWINALLLLFNLLPIFPLDGGQILQGLLWLVVGRALSLMIVTVIGLVTGLTLLAVSLVAREWWFSVLTGFAALCSLGGLLRARLLWRMRSARPQPGVACPACGKAPPAGDFWQCPRCRAWFNLFKGGGACPGCGARLAQTTCPDCWHHHPFEDWFAPALPAGEADGGPLPPGRGEERPAPP
jgi:Zn-dependent protease